MKNNIKNIVKFLSLTSLVVLIIFIFILMMVSCSNNDGQQNILLVSNIYSSDGLTVVGYRIIDYAYNTICYINSVQGIWCGKLQLELKWRIL